MEFLRLKRRKSSEEILLLGDIIKGQFTSYFIVETEEAQQSLISIDNIINHFIFPKLQKESSKLLEYLKFNELELYNKIQWY